VRRFVEASDRDEAVVEAASSMPGCGIVYVATRRRAEELSAAIAAARTATHYHGALKRAERDEAQRQFVGRRGRRSSSRRTRSGWASTSPTCAGSSMPTCPNRSTPTTRRSVVAGRDGDDARAILFYRQEDVGHQRFLGASGSDDEAQAMLVATRLEMLRTYAETTDCRRSLVLSYFGEPFDPPCDACDNCDHGRSAAAGDTAAAAFEAGVRVVHEAWGEAS
jgi:ATP-dependent DNA helicase RecQ